MSKSLAMRRFVALAVISIVEYLSGCANQSSRGEGRPTIMIAVKLAGGGAPTPQQAATVQKAMAPAAERAGLRFASSLASADFLVTVLFLPDPTDPTKGEIKVNRIERTPKNLGGGGGVDPTQAIRALEQWGESRSAPIY